MAAQFQQLLNSFGEEVTDKVISYMTLDYMFVTVNVLIIVYSHPMSPCFGLAGIILEITC